MKKVLDADFFNRDTKIVAQKLLGKFLVHRIGVKEISAMITETEAYDGPHDKASHASKGKTTRTKVMFGSPGVFYIYLVYGMHHMANIVTREHGYPAAVLVRGAVLGHYLPIRANGRIVLLDGPGKVTKFFHIDKKCNGKIASQESGLWFEDRGVKVPKNHIKKTPRIGVSYAGPKWSAKKLRFVLIP